MNLLHAFWWLLLAMVLGSFVLPWIAMAFSIFLRRGPDKAVRDGIGCLVTFWQLGLVLAVILAVASIVKLFI